MTTSAVAARRPGWRERLAVVGIIVAVLGLSAAAGALVGAGRDRLALLLLLPPVAVAGFQLLARGFDLVVLALPLAALAVPLELGTGTETRLPAAFLVAMALLGFWAVSAGFRGRFSVARSPLNRPMLVFCAICCLSLVWGIVWRDPGLIQAPTFIVTQLAALVVILISIGAALLVGNFAQTPRRLKIIVGLFLALGALMTITQLLHIRQSVLNDRGLWGLWVVTPAYGLLIAQPQLRWYWRLLLGALICTALGLSLIVNAQWLSGWAPIVVSILVATFLRSKRGFVIALVFVAVIAYSQLSFFNAVAEDNINDGSLQRISLWEQNWRVVRAHWLFGTGPAGYALYYMTYYREDARSTHNNYLDILAQFGFAGMAAWLWLAIAGVVEGWRLMRRAPPGFIRTLALTVTAGWVGAQVSMFFGDWVLPFAYNQGVGGYKYTVYSWIFLGMLIAIRALLDAEDANSRVVLGQVV